MDGALNVLLRPTGVFITTFLMIGVTTLVCYEAGASILISSLAPVIGYEVDVEFGLPF